MGDGYHGRRTASGARFNTYAKGTADDPFTIAYPPHHIASRNGWPPRALVSWVMITNQANGRRIRAKITDRGPFARGRCADLGRSGANALRMGGTARVMLRLCCWVSGATVGR
ncbi:septal ring lytic transglycosylase RlpA family protein [Rhodopseudomonas palustris]|uniref:Septal ring lytic transglycosylase RlpA family protein n=1 Tax=Rhodopseudomonas palustris TaxID=1076 RepID=A0AAX3DUA5_RHOPL|nr:septal ring lytic transglycosylase RlpA family protein [Rhodopseudomonas palustris]UYO38427.1 septal ring lytic transglycosylase RlpA family protein [Rhodopseudomonas palustris]